MNADQYKLVIEAFQAALEQPLDQQHAFVAESCADDTIVHDRVVEMLANDHRDRGALESNALDLAPTVLRLAASGIPSADVEALPPDTIGPYRIIRKLAEGGMGTVFEAQQENPDRIVALKTLRSGIQSPAMLRRFQREIRLLGKLQHPGIAHIHEAGTARTEAGTIPYFTMEFIRGRPLTEYAEAEDLSTRERLALVADVCDAVQYAHQKGVIHRDLKPGNILVQESADDGRRVKVLDFGVARAVDSDPDAPTQTTAHTNIGQLIGTMPYMSPEQVTGVSADLDTRTDVYSLGVVAYELLTGLVPLDVRSRSVPEAARVIREEEPRRMSSLNRSLRGEVETIVARAMEKDRERRYASASEFAADIHRYLSDEPIVARPATAIYQLKKFAKRNRGLVSGAGVAVLALVAATVASSMWAIDAGRAREAETESANRARAGETEMRWMAYRAGITAAQALLERDPPKARRQLDEVPAKHRNWEWHYLSAQLGNPMIVVDGPVDVAWRADGTPIAARRQGSTVSIVNMRTGKTNRIIHTQQDTGRLAFSPRAEFLYAFNAGEADARIWETATGRLLYRIPMNGGPPSEILFTPDDLGLAVITPGNTEIVLRDSFTGETRWSVSNVSGRAFFSADGSRLELRRSNQRAAIDAESGAFLLPWTQHSGRKFGVSSGDGDRRAEWNRNNEPPGIAILDVSSGKRLFELGGDSGGVTSVAFSPNARYLASTGYDGAVRIWDLDAGRQIRSFTASDSVDVAFGNDESELLFCSSQGGHLWRWRPNPKATILRGHASYVYLVCYSSDGSMIASAGWDEAVRLWSSRTGALLATLPFRGHHAHGLGFSEDGSEVIAAIALDVWGPRNFLFWDVGTGERTDASRFTIDEQSGEALREVTPEDSAFFWQKAAGGTKAVRFDGGEQAATSHDRTLLAAAGLNDAGELAGVTLTELATGRTLRHLGGRAGEVRAVAFSPDDSLLALAGSDSTIGIWSVSTGDQLGEMTGHTGKVYTVAFSPDGTRLASGGNDNTIRLWDVTSGEQVAVLTGHKSYVHSLRFSPDGSQLVSGSGDSTVRIWNTAPRTGRADPAVLENAGR